MLSRKVLRILCGQVVANDRIWCKNLIWVGSCYYDLFEAIY